MDMNALGSCVFSIVLVATGISIYCFFIRQYIWYLRTNKQLDPSLDNYVLLSMRYSPVAEDRIWFLKRASRQKLVTNKDLDVLAMTDDPDEAVRRLATEVLESLQLSAG